MTHPLSKDFVNIRLRIYRNMNFQKEMYHNLVTEYMGYILQIICY